MRILPIVLTVLLSGSAVLQGQTRDENWKRCGGSDPDGAIEACSALIQSGRDTGINLAAVFYDRGLAHAHKGDYDLAVEDYDQAIRLNASLANAFDARGVAYAHRRDYDHAIQDFDQALRLNPSLAEAYFSRGLTFRYKGDNDRAVEDFNQALLVNPNNAEVHYSRGRAYATKRDNDLAIQDCDQALRIDPTMLLHSSCGAMPTSQSTTTTAPSRTLIAPSN